MNIPLPPLPTERTCPTCSQFQYWCDSPDCGWPISQGHWTHLDETTAIACHMGRRWLYPAELSTARRARHATARALVAWHLERLADDAVLIVDELVTNACRYGGGPVSVTLWRTPSGIRGAVGDSQPAWPLRAHLPPRHGLRIVLSLAANVFVAPRPEGGKQICFDLDDRSI